MNDENDRRMVSGEAAGPATLSRLVGVKSFGQTAAGAEKLLPRFKLGDLEGESITIMSVEDFAGRFGPGFRVVVMRESTGEMGVLLGHWAVIGKYLARLQADGDLPVSCLVVKAQGKRYFDFADPLQPATSLEDAEKGGNLF